MTANTMTRDEAVRELEAVITAIRKLPKATECKALAARADVALAALRSGGGEGERESLRLFALDVLDDWPEGAPDGGDLQEIAVKHGLLVSTPAIVPCGENCGCAEFYDEGDEADCYRRAAFLTTPPATLPHPQPARGEAVVTPAVLRAVAAYFHDGPVRDWRVVRAIESALSGKPAESSDKPNREDVICPNCSHQFRAIPEQVQALLLASGHEPPFIAPHAAQPAEAGERVTALVEKWRAEVEKFSGSFAYVDGMAKCADELAACLSQQPGKEG